MEWDDLIELLHQMADVTVDSHDVECLDAHGETTPALNNILFTIMEAEILSRDCEEMVMEVTRDG